MTKLDVDTIKHDWLTDNVHLPSLSRSPCRKANIYSRQSHFGKSMRLSATPHPLGHHSHTADTLNAKSSKLFRKHKSSSSALA